MLPVRRALAALRSRSSSRSRPRRRSTGETDRRRHASPSLSEIYDEKGHSIGMSELRDLQQRIEHRASAPLKGVDPNLLPNSRIDRDTDQEIVFVLIHDGTRIIFKVDKLGPISIKSFGSREYEIPPSMANDLLLIAANEFQNLLKTNGEGVQLLEHLESNLEPREIIPDRESLSSGGSSSDEESAPKELKTKKVNVLGQRRSERTGTMTQGEIYQDINETTGDAQRLQRDRERVQEAPTPEKIMRAYVRDDFKGISTASLRKWMETKWEKEELEGLQFDNLTPKALWVGAAKNWITTQIWDTRDEEWVRLYNDEIGQETAAPRRLITNEAEKEFKDKFKIDNMENWPEMVPNGPSAQELLDLKGKFQNMKTNSIDSNNSEVKMRLRNLETSLEGLDASIQGTLKEQMKDLVKMLVKEKTSKEKFKKAFEENEQLILLNKRNTEELRKFQVEKEKRLQSQLNRVETRLQDFQAELGKHGSKKKTPPELGEISSDDSSDGDIQEVDQNQGNETIDYAANQRNFTDNEEFWEGILDTYSKTKDNLPKIPKVTLISTYQIITSRFKILNLLNKLTEAKPVPDLFTRLFECGRILIDFGAAHSTITEIFTGYCLTPEEKRLIYQHPKARNNLTELLNWINSSYNRLSGEQMMKRHAINFVNKEMAKRDCDLQLIASELLQKHVAALVRTKSNFHKFTVDQKRVLYQEIGKEIFIGELKLNYGHIYDRAMENGILSEELITLASKLQGSFLVMNSKKGVNTVQSTKQKKKKEKEEMKKKINNVSQNPPSQDNRTPQKPILGVKEKKFKERDVSELKPIPNKPGLYTWTSRDGKIRDIILPCAFHRDKKVSAQECFKLNHCWECSRENMLSPPVSQCSGTNHQWRRRTPSKKQ